MQNIVRESAKTYRGFCSPGRLISSAAQSFLKNNAHAMGLSLRLEVDKHWFYADIRWEVTGPEGAVNRFVDRFTRWGEWIDEDRSKVA